MSIGKIFQMLVDLEAKIGSTVSFDYVNYKGLKASRKVKIISLREGSTQWHKENQWLLKAYDLDKNAEREFAIKDIVSELKDL